MHRLVNHQKERDEVMIEKMIERDNHSVVKPTFLRSLQILIML